MKGVINKVGIDNFSYLAEWLVMPFGQLKLFEEKFGVIPKASPWYDTFSDFPKVYKNFRNNAAGLTDWIIRTSGAVTCPYCNAAYTFTRRNKSKSVSNGNLDHFFPKDIYPQFALSYYNLVPSCSLCNRMKSNRRGNKGEKLISPYYDSYDQSAPHPYEHMVFSYRYENIDRNTMTVPYLKIKDNDLSMKAQKKFFMIDEEYRNHSDAAGEIVDKARIYCNPSRLRMVQGAFSTLHLSNRDFARYYFGYYTSKEDYLKRPLSKMASDIKDEVMKTYQSFSEY